MARSIRRPLRHDLGGSISSKGEVRHHGPNRDREVMDVAWHQVGAFHGAELNVPMPTRLAVSRSLPFFCNGGGKTPWVPR